MIDADDIEILYGQRTSAPLRDVVGYRPGWGSVSAAHWAELERLTAAAPEGASAPRSPTAQG